MKTQARPKATIAATALVAALALPAIAPSAMATGIPTIDAANLAQAIMEVMESIEQTTTLIDSYNTQLRQLENQLQNSLAPAAYIWEQANQTMSKLEAAQHLLDVYGGDLDGYLSQFKDVNWYKHSPCFTQYGCTPEERAALASVLDSVNDAQTKANKAAAKVSHEQLKDDRSRERKKQIQDQAQSAQGQMQALGAANQFAGLQSDQLIDIKEQLNALSLVLLRQAEKQNEREKMQEKAAVKLRGTSGLNRTSQPKGWLP